jgi:S1-C subfamily serine protease
MPRVLAGLAAAGLLAGCTLPLPGAKAATLSPEQVFARAKPAMVLVQVDYGAKISLPRPDVADPAVQAIRRKLQAQYDSGRHPELLNHDAFVAAFDAELYGNPDAYFTPGKDVFSQDGEALEVNGSGFIASEAGFIATSAHVVATKDDEVQKEISTEVLKSINEGLAADVLTNTNRSAEEKQKFRDFYSKYSAKYLKVENQTKEIHVGLAKATPGKPLQTNGMVAHIVEAGEPIPGKDVAIIKVDPGASKLPSLAVGDEGALKPAETVNAIGYPGESIFHNQDTNPRPVEPTLTHGGFQPGSEPQHGYNALGTEATIQQGESGGPMVDARGTVVGVIAFGIVDKDGTLIPNLGFGVPASVVKEYLDKAKAGAGESQTETQYRMALAEFDQQHFKNALPMFREVKSRWSDNPYVDAYISDSQKGIVDKADKTPPTPGEVAAYGGGGAVGLLLLLLLGWWILRRRRAHRRLLAALAEARGGAVMDATPVAATEPAQVQAAAAIAAADPLPVEEPTLLVATAPGADAPRTRTRRAAGDTAAKASTPKVAAKAPRSKAAAKTAPSKTAAKAAPAKAAAKIAPKARSASKAASKPAASKRAPAKPAASVPAARKTSAARTVAPPSPRRQRKPPTS